MHCTQCQYPLWDLAARVCPECGKPFAPSEYTFVNSSVQFLCPHCRQDYYGMGERGHLVPSEFDCVRCGQRIREDEMLVLPTRGVREEQTVGARLPWLRREKGRVDAAFRTLGLAMFAPAALARGLCAQTGQTNVTPGQTRLRDAIWFAIICLGGVGAIVGIGCAILVTAMGVLIFSAQGGGAMTPGQQAGLGGVQTGAYLTLFMFVVPLATTMLWALCTHGLLVSFARPCAGISRTIECFAYASAVFIAGILLVCVWPSMVVLVPWVGLSAGFILAPRQGVSGLTSAWAVATPPLFVLIVVVVWIVIAVNT
jgi:hypothetical protein